MPMWMELGRKNRLTWKTIGKKYQDLYMPVPAPACSPPLPEQRSASPILRLPLPQLLQNFPWNRSISDGLERKKDILLTYSKWIDKRNSVLCLSIILITYDIKGSFSFLWLYRQGSCWAGRQRTLLEQWLVLHSHSKCFLSNPPKADSLQLSLTSVL